MKNIILSIFLLTSGILHASNMSNEEVIKGIVKEKANPAQPVVGANIYWAGTLHGTTTNADGEFEITLPENSTQKPLVISFVGFKTDTVQVSPDMPVFAYLEENIELSEVVIRERRKGQYISTMDAVQTTKVTSSELQKAACCNLSESFETNASVDVSFSDAVTGAKQIKMLGLAGIYVQTISENIPSVRGMAAPYGLGYTPGPWMESIQISKGTASVSNGYEAVTGQINVEYKKAESPEWLHVNLYGNDAMKTEANVNYTHQLTDSLSTMIFLHGENQGKEIDNNGDNFLDMPNVKQINFMNRWNWTPKNGGHREVGFKVLDEQRKSGQLGAFDSDNNNLYGIEINTRRYELFAKNGILFDKPGTSLGIQLSGSYHNQNSVYGSKNYDGTQYNAYLNVIYMGNFGTDLHSYKTGASFLGDSFDETLNETAFTHDEMVPGVFFEYNYHLRNRLNILAGVRADYSSVYGTFITPRVHAKWNVNNWLIWRASAGKGFRTSIPLSENSYMLASSRGIVIDNNLQQEEAVNIGTSLNATIPVGTRELSVTLDYYHTNFIQQVIRDIDSNPHQVHFTNLDGASYSNAIQAELFYEVIDGLTINAAYRVNDVKQTINGQLRKAPLQSHYKGLLSLSYATRLNKWQFDLTGQFNGGGRMPDPVDENPLWEKEFSPFTVVNTQITKNFKKWSLYAGAENLFNFKMDNPIIASNDPWGSNFDGSMIWGSVHGRKIYVGLRYTLKNY
ncbi:MAG: TonB-dependent receptor [Prolixibacteraceae bacterium]|nr:TonB-dependent receptor [Prolixibacteraceae bacterium]MBN2650024.1 TonB-dependent receptor [Prolixibacteraceae bacterium]